MKNLLQILALIAAVTIIPVAATLLIPVLYPDPTPKSVGSGDALVKIDGVEMSLPDLPRLTLWSAGDIIPRASNEATSFHITRGVSYQLHAPLDDVLSDLSGFPALGIVTFLKVGPIIGGYHQNEVACTETPVIILGRMSSAFCNAASGFNPYGLEGVSHTIASNRIRFFGSPVQMRCTAHGFSNDPNGISCTFSGRMHTGHSVRFDLYSNEDNNRSWPNIDAPASEWQAHFTAMEDVLAAMVLDQPVASE